MSAEPAHPRATPRAEALLEPLEHSGVKLGLERMTTLLRTLGNPHLRTPTVLVGGTNGKGSTSALLAAIASAAGYRCGHFLSPHLETLAERIQINGRAIRDLELESLLVEILTRARESRLEPPTYFEALTLAALLFFARQQIDLAIVEVGLGGRLDATNVTEPIVSVITSISFDHEKILGSTLQAIAGEKFGIARPNRPLVAWTQPAEVDETLSRHASSLGTELLKVPELCRIAQLEGDERQQRVQLITPAEQHELELFLPGQHQLTNLALAVMAAEKLAQTFSGIDSAAIATGVASCRWPGRLEWIDLPDGKVVLVDAAHNSGGAAALVEYLLPLRRRWHLLFGALGDKDIAAMLRPLAAQAERVTLTCPPSPRAVDPRGWLPWIETPAAVVDQPIAALESALDGLEAGCGLLICGSIYLLGELRPALRRRFGVPAPTVS